MSIPNSFNPLGSKKEVLPPGYKRVEYLETDGNAYIDLGFSFIDDYTFSGRALVMSPQSQIFGVTTSSDTGLSFWVYNIGTTGSSAERYATGVLKCNNTWFVSGREFEFSLSADSVTVDENEYSNPTPEAQRVRSFTTDGNVLLFALHTRTPKAGTRLYKFNVARHNGSTKMELVPCLSPDNTPCMVDTVRGTVYTNQGAGTFLWG